MDTISAGHCSERQLYYIGPNGEMVAVDNSCFLPLGLESLAVAASDMTASTVHSEPNKEFAPTQGRLNNKPSTQSGVHFQGLLWIRFELRLYVGLWLVFGLGLGLELGL